MKEKIKSLRLNITVSALISIVIGVLFLVFPDQTLITMSKVVACVIIFAGLAVALSNIVERGMNALGIVVGLLIALIGAWIFRSPDSVISIVPIAIGVILVFHGVQDLGLAMEALSAKASNAWVAFLLAALNIILGIACIAAAFKIVSFGMRIIGLMLLYDGITDLGIVHKVRKSTGGFVDSVITKEEDVL